MTVSEPLAIDTTRLVRLVIRSVAGERTSPCWVYTLVRPPAVMENRARYAPVAYHSLRISKSFVVRSGTVGTYWFGGTYEPFGVHVKEYGGVVATSICSC